LAVTGEGMFDAGSLRGKVPGGVLRIAGELGVRAVVVCGQAVATVPGVRVESLGDWFGLDAAMARPGQLLVEMAARLAGEEAPRGGAGG
jgi:glycerate 2-kinase